ncbi:MAG: nucleotidyltransferase domain-containing protein, partial [bacterium]|nr:nucleotidyltransferase domain-containing protein [bacterium]
PEFKLYLFGSRVDDDKKGGDIDILILSGEPLKRKDKRSIKIAFYNKFGYQKLDLVHFIFDDPSPFKELALLEGVEL